MGSDAFLKNIVWASFGPDVSENVVEFVIYFAKAFDSKIYSLYVKPTTYNKEKEECLTETEKLLNEEWNEYVYRENINKIESLQRKIHNENIKTANAMLEGVPCHEILKFANNKSADLIVIDKGKKIGNRCIVQKTTLYVVANTTIPVITVCQSNEFKDIRNILVPVDMYNIYSEAFKTASHISSVLKSDITHLNVQNRHDPSLPAEVVERKHGDAYFHLSKSYGNKNINKVVLDAENISDGIIEYTNSHDIDLIVLQTFSGEKQNVFHSDGSVAEKVIEGTDCPVLTIKANNG